MNVDHLLRRHNIHVGHCRYSAIIMSELYGIVDAHEDLLATLLLACEAVMHSRREAHRSTASAVVSSGAPPPIRNESTSHIIIVS